MELESSKAGKLLSLDGVGVVYPKRGGFFRHEGHWALKEISFSIFRGETLGVLGRNGVGKSTLLRLLANIIAPDRGKVSRAPGLTTALLSLHAGFIPALTGRQNAILSGITLGLPKRQMEERIEEISRFAELGEYIDQPVASYSSGMKARLGFSVAIQVDPDVLLIDEVISVGDEDFRKKSSAIVQQRVDANETSILVTHNAQLAKSLCSRAIWIEDGRIRLNGDAEQVVDAYLGARPAA